MKRKIFFVLLILGLFQTNANALTIHRIHGTDILANSQTDLDENFAGLAAGTADTAGTGADTYSIGDGGNTDKTLKAGNDDGSKPFIRYVATQDVWAFSNLGARQDFFVAASSDTSGNLIGAANSVWVDNNALTFEGATANGFKTRITPTDPTDSRVITLPNENAFVGYKIGTLTRDMTAASGNVSYTGVGFKPRKVIFIANRSSDSVASIGFDDTSVLGAIYNAHSASANTWGNATTVSIFAEQGGGNQHTGKIVSLDADGFTLTWTKVSSSTGTLQVIYIALG